MKNLTTLPDDLPVPVDDGACAHLEGSRLPQVVLTSTADREVNLGQEEGIVVIYIYPRIGRPDAPPMEGWNDIPGARGCTPQSCAFRDHYAELQQLGATVYGLSAQPLTDQKEAVARLQLPFELLNDESLELAKALNLPTFTYNSISLLKRITLIAKSGIIQKVFYPVFPPDENAADVVAWLRESITSR